MATANIIGTFCKSNTGEHADITLSINNVGQGNYPNMTLSDITADVTEDEKVTFARLLIKMKYIGKTTAQLRSNIISGFTINV